MASKGDQFAPLFTLAEDFHNNACINWSNDPLELYARAYKKAAEKLVIEVVRARILSAGSLTPSGGRVGAEHFSCANWFKGPVMMVIVCHGQLQTFAGHRKLDWLMDRFRARNSPESVQKRSVD